MNPVVDLQYYSRLYPKLLLEEVAMVLAWRAIATERTIIRIPYKDNRPVYVDFYYDNGSIEQAPSQNELTPFEIEIIELGRQLGHGELVLMVSEGQPRLIMGDTKKRVKLPTLTGKQK